MVIHAAADMAKALQTPSPEPPFQVGDLQLRAIRELAKIFDADTKILNRYALTTPLALITNKSSKLSRMEVLP